MLNFINSKAYKPWREFYCSIATSADGDGRIRKWGEFINRGKLIVIIILIAALFAIRFFPERTIAASNTGVREQVYSGLEGRNSSDAAQNDTAIESKPVVINLAGDVLLAAGVGKVIANKGVDYPWENVAGLFGEGDITAANLECCISTGGRPEPEKQYTFRASPAVLEGARRAGVDIFTLANNHVLDYGYLALEDTLGNLRRCGILFTGAGLNLEQALTPVIVDKHGLKVGFLAFTRVFPHGSWVAGPEKWGVANGFEHGVVQAAVQSLAERSDFVVVSVHWGKEKAEYPCKDQIMFGRMLADAGANVVIGHHPHVIQGIEFYNNNVIAYSSGNFIFSSSAPKAREGIILQIEAESGQIHRARVIPTGIYNAQPKILSGTDRQRVLNRLDTLSTGMNTVIDGEGFLTPKA